MKTKLIVPLIVSLLVTSLAVMYIYSQKYTQDSPTTATAGILFSKTLNLEVYKRVSSGLDMWGSYANYSRSDRHGDIVTVYCNDYCEK